MNFLEIILTDFYPFFFFFPILFNLFSFFRENREEFCSSSRLEIILRISFRHPFREFFHRIFRNYFRNAQRENIIVTNISLSPFLASEKKKK